jgi:hypothetical protein
MNIVRNNNNGLNTKLSDIQDPTNPEDITLLQGLKVFVSGNIPTPPTGIEGGYYMGLATGMLNGQIVCSEPVIIPKNELRDPNGKRTFSSYKKGK